MWLAFKLIRWRVASRDMARGSTATMSSRRRQAETERVSPEALGSRLQAVLNVSVDTSSGGPQGVNKATPRVATPRVATPRVQERYPRMPKDLKNALSSVIRKDKRFSKYPDGESRLDNAATFYDLRLAFGDEITNDASSTLKRKFYAFHRVKPEDYNKVRLQNVEIVVPDNAKAGDRIRFKTVAGSLSMTVPPTATPGGRVKVSLPWPARIFQYRRLEVSDIEVLPARAQQTVGVEDESAASVLLSLAAQ